MALVSKPPLGTGAAALLLAGFVSASTGFAQQSRDADTPAVAPSATSAGEGGVGLDLYGDPLPRGAVARLGTVRYRHPGWYKRVAFLADNETFVVGTSDNALRAWNARSGGLVYEFESYGGQFQAFCLSPDGRNIATLCQQMDFESRESQYRLSIWRAPLWRERSRFEWKEQRGLHSPTQIAFSSDGAALLAGTEGGSIRVWDATAGKELLNRNMIRGGVEAIACSPKNDVVAIGGQQGVVLWKFLSQDEPQVVHGFDRGAQALRFSHDGAMLAIGSSDERAARVFQMEPWRELAALQGESESYYREGLCFSPDDRRLIVPSNSTNAVEVFDIRTGALVRTLKANTQARDAAISPDGRLIATVGSRAAIVVFDADTGERLSDRVVGHDESPYEVRFTPDGSKVVSADPVGTIRIWDAATGRQERMLDHAGFVAGIELSSDGARLVSCGLDDSVRLWETETGRLLFKLPGHGRTGGNASVEVGFSPDGERFLSFGGDLLVRTYSARTGKILTEQGIRPQGQDIERDDDGLPKGNADPFGPAGRGGFAMEDPRFTPDGLLMLTAGRGASAVRVFEVATGEEVDAFDLDAPLEGYGLSPDGKRLVTFEQSPQPPNGQPGQRVRKSTLRLRDFASKQVLREVELPGSFRNQVVFSRSGELMAFGVSIDSAERIREQEIVVFDANRIAEIARIADPTNAPTHLAFSPDEARLAAGQQDSSVLIWDLSKFSLDERDR